MTAYVAQRAIQAFVTLFCVVTLVFFLARVGGDPVLLLLPPEATAEQVETARQAMGYNDPIFMQYARFLADVVRGDFGDSVALPRPALGVILERLPATLELAFASFVIGTLISFILGVAVQLPRFRRLRTTVLWLALVRQAMPIFWFGLVLIVVFSVYLDWLPALGRGGLSHLVLPSLTLGTYQVALFLRLFNAEFSSQRGEDYVRTAFAKGMSEDKVVIRHMLPNVLLPIVTLAGLNFAALLTGAVVTETVFSWPGVGRLVIEAVNQRDFPVVQAGVTVIAVLFIVINFSVDLLYGWIDPRIRLSK